MVSAKVHGKAAAVRGVAGILKRKSVPNADKGEGVKKSKHFADVISGSSPTAAAVCSLPRLLLPELSSYLWGDPTLPRI